MEYPGTRLKKGVRMAILIIFVSLFFVLSPIIIMYTAGYRYDWHNGLLKETGAISVDIEPKNASIYLSGIKLKDKMPVRLNNIAPGKYNLKVSSPGYNDWTKDIEVKNKQTTYIKEISLIKNNKPSLLINEKLSSFALSSDGQFIIYATAIANGSSEFWLYNVSENKSLFLMRSEATSPGITFNQNSHFAAIHDAQPPYNHFTIIDADNPLKQTNLISLTKNPLSKFQWDNSTDSLLYYSIKDDIYTYDTAAGNVSLFAKQPLIDWYMDTGSHLWAIRLNTSTGEQELVKDLFGAGDVISLTNKNSADNTVQPVNAKWSLLSAKNNTALIKTDRSSEMILVYGNNKYNIAGDDFKISPYNNWWLIWTKWEIWTFTEGEEPYLLNRSGENLRQVLPLDKYNTLALVWADKSTVLYPYYLVTHPLANEEISHAEADSGNKIFYFQKTGGQQSGLWKLEY